jgi:hypothetical protein
MFQQKSCLRKRKSINGLNVTPAETFRHNFVEKALQCWKQQRKALVLKRFI